jgi:translation initiation factor IF-2
MRARGAKVTDMVILIVAANDGVMPQTVEAINHAKDANVPIIVAINKIDLPEANPQKVREALTAYEIVPEEWGGKNLFVEISAKQKINIEGLLEAVLMQAEMLELKANPNIRAKGTIIESKIEHGPSTPVEILGIDGIPSAGDPFQAVVSDRYAKQIGQKRQELKRAESAKQFKKVTLESFNDMIKEGAVQDLKIVIKADVDGSVQALKDALEKLSTDEIRVKVIHAGAGGINESDVMLASASNAVVIGYHVRPLPKIADLAESEKVSIKMYNIIFEVTDDIKKAMEGMLAPDIVETITGHAEVKQIFKVSKIGTIAGCILVDGKIQRTNKVRVIRESVVVFDGELKSLKRFKDDANEVLGGQECGIGVNNFNDVRVDDTIEFYKLTEVAKKLGV